jgi:hypothetical protein
VALALCGFGYEAPPDIVERRERWLSAVPHEGRPGQTAVGEIDRDLIGQKPDQIRQALSSVR